MVIGYIGNPLEVTQTTISTQESTMLIVTNVDDLEPTYTGTYIITCVERFEEFIDIPDDEPVGTTLVIITIRRGYLKNPIKLFRKSLHPV